MKPQKTVRKCPQCQERVAMLKEQSWCNPCRNDARMRRRMREANRAFTALVSWKPPQRVGQ